ERGADVLEGIQFATNETPVRLRSMEFDHHHAGTLDTIELSLMAERQQDILDLVSRLRTIAAVRHITYKRGSSIVRKRERLVSRRVVEDDDDVNGGL
ncbi:MAG: hypothetical protein M3490_03105, partial [Chloroflexota bacterium]|nr:hypothetical protein [Chloroflexota bacterium]